ncbi:hypothetical protein D9758_004087 [Tetrapyrgos nigripes]|uniref:RWD domain-containing protein n=1 Tax=Tetrapyrgos nigripes TaxID=182062 RepID=A0A8H5GUL2_9AGAR|nr:hypothetical protein D9758_004087 [Tetrapyrgos nigripes]
MAVNEDSIHIDDHVSSPFSEERLSNLIECLLSEREPVGSELDVLKSIYGPESIQVWEESNSTIRYQVILALPSYESEDINVKILVSLPPNYPSSSPPQLQLLSRYIGVDSTLFGDVLRTFISSTNGIEFIPDNVCVFDGLQYVLERCTKWYEENLSREKAGEMERENLRHHEESESTSVSADSQSISTSKLPPPSVAPLPEGIKIFEAEPIVDRKSVFVGRVCAISHPSEVPLILAHLSADRRIARAAHPIINAWRCKVGNVVHQDNDDDGETAAGGRLAHLLQILDLSSHLVIVTRYFGGIHLGPDRFKHINQAARNALEDGGFLEDREKDKDSSKGRRKR